MCHLIDIPFPDSSVALGKLGSLLFHSNAVQQLLYPFNQVEKIEECDTSLSLIPDVITPRKRAAFSY